MGQAVLGEDPRQTDPEAVGLDHIAAHVEEARGAGSATTSGLVSTSISLHPSRSGPPKSSGPRLSELEVRAHGAVEDDAPARAAPAGRSTQTGSSRPRSSGRRWTSAHRYRCLPGRPTGPVASGLRGARIYTKTGRRRDHLVFSTAGRVRKDSWRIDAERRRRRGPGGHRRGPGAQTAPARRSTSRLVTLARDLYVLMAEVATAPENRPKLRGGVQPGDAGHGASRSRRGIDDLLVPASTCRATSPCRARTRVVRRALDQARTVVRRAERLAVAEPIGDGLARGPLPQPPLRSALWAMARWQEGPRARALQGPATEDEPRAP